MGHSRKLSYGKIEHIIRLHDLPEWNFVNVQKTVGVGKQRAIRWIQKQIEKQFLKF